MWFVAVPLLVVAIEVLMVTVPIPLLWGLLHTAVLASPLAVYLQLSQQLDFEIHSLSTVR